MKKHIGMLALIAIFTACVKDKPNPGPNVPPSLQGRRVYIGNEGSLGNGNASLSCYNIDQDSVYNDVYTAKNNQPLGDVFLSMTTIGQDLFLAVNNSDKIVVIDKTDFSLKGSMPIRKPRYMLQVTPEKMYVSSLYYPEINIINPKTLTHTGKINLDFPNSEGMTLLNGKVYACNWDTACAYLYEIDPQKDSITSRIPLAGAAPQQVLVDRNQQLWVLGGNAYKQKTASLTQVDPISRKTVKQFVFPAGAEILKPVWNPSKDTLYYLGVDYNGGTSNNGVYQLPITANALPATQWIPAKSLQYYWALGIDSATNHIYLGDPKGFIQKGTVSIYQPSGLKIKSFDVGLGPASFYFD